jgi:uncharacterized protein (TIGR00730 family)
MSTPPAPPAIPNGPPLAYRDESFLDSEEGRPVRILAEYLQPLHAFHEQRVHDTVVFFGSARVSEDGPMSRWYREARELARLLTEWSHSLESPAHRFLVCSGGGPGIMAAANRGAADAGGPSVGLNIGLPHEQRPNPWITPELSFQFHYFFMRKLWFAYLARAIVAFPGGFGTMDELFELLTLAQTRKIARPLMILLYGPSFWNEIINFEALERHGVISAEDRALVHFADTPQQALDVLRTGIADEGGGKTPSVAHSVTPHDGNRRS